MASGGHLQDNAAVLQGLASCFGRQLLLDETADQFLWAQLIIVEDFVGAVHLVPLQAVQKGHADHGRFATCQEMKVRV